MGDCDDIGSPISVNVNGRFYELGKSYSLLKKWEVVITYLKLWEEKFPMKPSMSSLARCAGVTEKWARKVVDELTKTGQLENPCVTKRAKNVTRCVGLNFTLEEEVFFLALQIECPFRPNMDYVAKLKDNYDCDISASTISVWFTERCIYPHLQSPFGSQSVATTPKQLKFLI
jgi:hypothetical protein